MVGREEDEGMEERRKVRKEVSEATAAEGIDLLCDRSKGKT
jgi:hypothetical protein